MSDIVVKFTPSGHGDLIKAINNLSKAQNNLIKVNNVARKSVKDTTANMATMQDKVRLNQREYQKLSAALRKTGKPAKDLGLSFSTLRRAAQGNTQALAQFRRAIRQTTKATKLQTKANSGLLTSNRLLDHSFATMRSHMLLFSFAMSLGIRQIARFGKEAAKLQQMERAFGGLSGGATNASVAVKKLEEATNGTLSEFDLFQQANNAMILGVTKNSDEMARMFDMAQRLGAALGKDTKLSVESLVTGIGRQSRLMLDNIGIIVKAEKAYASYAAELGKTADTLTNSEKRQAFMNAALEAGQKALENMPPEILTTDQRFQQLSASLDNASKKIGEGFLPMMELLASALMKFSKAITPERVQTFATLVGVTLTGAMIKYRAAVLNAVRAQNLLGWGLLATTIGAVGTSLLELVGIFPDFDDEMEKGANATKNFTQEVLEYERADIASELEKQRAELLKLTGSTDTTVETQKKAKTTLEDYIKTNEEFKAIITANTTGVQDKTNVLNDNTNKLVDNTVKTAQQNEEDKKRANQLKENINLMLEYDKALAAGFSSIPTYLETGDKFLAQEAKTFNAREASLSQEIKNIEMLQQVTGDTEKYAQVLQMLIDKKEALVKANLKDAKWEQLTTTMKIQQGARMMKIVGQMAGANQKNALFAARMDRNAAIVNTLAAVTDVLKEGTGPMRYVEAAAALAYGMAQVSKMQSAIDDMGGGGSSGGGGSVYGKFEHGGYVGGRLHSQGGTIIEAERGEFVMSRNAVESIGLETLNQMNQTGGGGNINVNVSGNVLTQDFVEGELAESIKEAVRRGSDFGIG
jgi:hypothetical protein